jgi:virginiamycin B lyase
MGDAFPAHRHFSDARPSVCDIYEFRTVVGTLDATRGTDDAIWSSEDDFGSLGPRVHRLTTAGVLTDIHLSLPGIHPQGIAASKNGSIWIAAPADRDIAQQSDKLIRLSASGDQRAYSVPTSDGWPFGIAVDSKDRVWFTELEAGKVGRLLPDGSFTEYPLSDPKGKPTSIAVTPDGLVWFIESDANRIGLISANSQVKEFAIPADSGYRLNALAVDADGNAWFTRSDAGMVGVIDRLGHARYFPAHDALHIARGGDGAMWFTQLGEISRIAESGVIASYSTPVKHLGVLVGGPDQNLWFSLSDSVLGGLTNPGGFGRFALTACTDKPLSPTTNVVPSASP